MPDPIEIFRAGSHQAANGRQVTITADDLVNCAAAYNPDLHQAPLVVGHPKHNGPAYGWVKDLKADGDLLLAEVDQVAPEFSDAVAAGHFKKISASFYPKGHPSNPTPAALTLRHVGCLGAMAPAVKGLAGLSLDNFNEEETDLLDFTAGEASSRWAFSAIASILRGFRERIIETDGQEQANQVVGSWDLAAIEEAARDPQPTATTAPDFNEPGTSPSEKENTLPDKTLEEREAELAQREADTTSREASFAEAEMDRRKKANASFVDGLVTEGRVPPAKRDAMVAHLDYLEAPGGALEFSEIDTPAPAADSFRDLVKDWPPVVDLSERAGEDEDPLDFSNPTELAEAAQAYQAKQAQVGRVVSTVQAVAHVKAEGKKSA